MAYIISSHMLSKAVGHKRIDTASLCAQAMIHCIAMFDRILTEQNQKLENKSPEHLEVLRTSAQETIRLIESNGRQEFEIINILKVAVL